MGKLTAKELELMNSKLGLKELLRHDEFDLKRALDQVKYLDELRRLQVELVKLQTWVIEENKKVVIVFEGRDAAGKRGAIERITSHINPRYYRIVALPRPTEDEKGQWYFQRYVEKLPRPGEIVFFDRSWYNRAMVEPVNGFCTDAEYKIFMSQVNDVERMIVESGTYLRKIYFSINKKVQAKRFEELRKSPLKKWQLSPVDKRAVDLWDEYTTYKKLMIKHTDTELCPWKIMDANDKNETRIEALDYILNSIPYKAEISK